MFLEKTLVCSTSIVKNIRNNCFVLSWNFKKFLVIEKND